jgi:hypothetical protein
MIGRNYFAKQVAILLKFAQATTDSQVAAGLIDKAADLKDRLEKRHLPNLNCGRALPTCKPNDRPPWLAAILLGSLGTTSTRFHQSAFVKRGGAPQIW